MLLLYSTLFINYKPGDLYSSNVDVDVVEGMCYGNVDTCDDAATLVQIWARRTNGWLTIAT